MSEPNAEKEKSLRILQSKISDVKKIYNLRNNVREYLISQLNNAFGKIGFLPYYQSKDREWNHFFANQAFFKNKSTKAPDSFRFFVDIDKLFEKNTLDLYFEMFGVDAKYGVAVRDYLLQKDLNVLVK